MIRPHTNFLPMKSALQNYHHFKTRSLCDGDKWQCNTKVYKWHGKDASKAQVLIWHVLNDAGPIWELE